MRADQRRSTAILVGLVSSGLMLTGLLLTVNAMPPQPGSGSPQGTRVDDTALGNAAGGDHWLAYGRTYSEQRFSPLTQISDRTVSRLRPEWFVELPNDRGLVSTPLVVDGVLYFIGSMNVVRAVDARSGKLRWQYDPEVRAHAGRRRRQPVPVLDRRARSRHRRVSVALPDHARGNLGLQLQHGYRARRLVD